MNLLETVLPSTPTHCRGCGRRLEATSDHYVACPAGHGRLVPSIDRPAAAKPDYECELCGELICFVCRGCHDCDGCVCDEDAVY